MQPDPQLYTYARAAELLSISVSSVRKRVRLGELAVQRIGRSVRIPRAALDTFQVAYPREEEPKRVRPVASSNWRANCLR